ncbi:MAG: hypothetical protein E7Z86_01575 [Methanosphaera stadtmanae]|jgi:hypothetical protein|nr:hypothetical protein [Methanosphaera stadtmanae]
MKWYVSFIIVIFLLVGLIYVASSSTSDDIEPLGRLAFVKIANPDMYPGHVHANLLAQYAQERDSKCAIVLHYAGSSNYRNFMNGNTYIIEMAFMDTAGAQVNIDWGQVIDYGLHGVPNDKWDYKVDGEIYDKFEDAWARVLEFADSNQQKGPIPMVWHGTVREGSIFINPGCGFPLYYQVCCKEFGHLGGILHAATGSIFPYFNNPYRSYEIEHASELQYYYTHNMLNYE